MEATEEHLALFEQSIALEETAGAWTDEHHPDLCTEEDMERWRVELWQGTARESTSNRCQQGN